MTLEACFMHRLAIYDMDKTITRKATFGPFLAYAVPRYQPWRVVMLPLVVLTTLGYALRLVDRARLKEINLGMMMGHRIDPPRLAALARGFAGQTLSRNMLPRALDRIAADKADGFRVVLASASYAFYVKEVGALIGIGDVIATRTSGTSHGVSPRIDGENCYGTAKLRMVEDWMQDQGIARGDAEIRFYSDHVSDVPCLEFADAGFATNPHAALRKLAAERGWTVFDWV
jgi:HAD superfamily phosphoserine phosphatase-like hydrolase